jgi:hypothetical protein
MAAAEWRRTGATLAARYVANEAAYLQAGYPNGDAYLRAFVRQSWPNVGHLVKRYIREGWRAQMAAEAI